MGEQVEVSNPTSKRKLDITINRIEYYKEKENLSTKEIDLPYIGKSHTNECTVLSILSAVS
jgi:hypothetical protein